jgi:cytochrome oxidase Cu insertion factor (SCO1/SenC/PrrC family)
MSGKAGSKKANARNDEWTFAVFIIIASCVMAAGFFCLLFFLTQQENENQNFSRANTNAVIIAPDHPRQLVNFSLTNCTGRVVTQTELQGKFLVVDFLLTSCGLACPVVNSHMSQIQQLTANQPDVKLVSLTVDPRDDTPEALLQFGQRFNANTNRWLFLTGDKDKLYHFIATSFLEQDTNGIYAYMPGNFADTQRIAIVDSHGQVCAYFDGLADNVASAVVEQIQRLRN